MNTNNNKQNTAAVGLSKLIKPALNFAAITELLELIKEEMGVKDSGEKWDKIKSIASSISVQFMGLSIDGKKLTVLIRKGVLKKYSVKKQIHWT